MFFGKIKVFEADGFFNFQKILETMGENTLRASPLVADGFFNFLKMSKKHHF